MTPTNTQIASVLTLARNVLDIEADAIRAMSGRLNGQFAHAIDLMLACKGRVVVSGMGKSGHIGRKIAATLASTGTPAFFMHPGEAAHGDLGMITAQDVVLALSNSGESEELVALLNPIKRRGVPLIAITGNLQSTLARQADVVLDAGVEKEACTLNLAPTASTSAQLALGDALAVVLLDLRGFGSDDFALSHPGGSLGRRLLVHVRDVMHAGEALPVVQETTLLRDALLVMSEKGLGLTAVVDDQQRVKGVFTDGDLRRVLNRDVDLKTTPVSQVMSANPRRIHADKLAAEAVQMMQTYKITGLLVVNESDHLVGAFNMQDLLRAGVV
ncbi:KpsF/GutQ family sugar-phosphate isomerase [Chitinivorax tropicus]|uniref:KpsF/GutQ family sugar-phosphate isomerase n=1 Tax=Chitinivorax tropicus TaxID=714531 RepID=UPI00161913E9|nr:KpsF/GutQ family sugar-phosphate isomerase [Chitinivorax tropicus]